jgi:hypothetical protein
VASAAAAKAASAVAVAKAVAMAAATATKHPMLTKKEPSGSFFVANRYKSWFWSIYFLVFCAS